MEISYLLITFILIPILGILFTAFAENKQENYIFWVSFITISLHSALAVSFTAYWLFNGISPIATKAITLYHTETGHFSIDLYFDHLTVAFGAIMCLITFMVALFSRYYMHREKGYKRFFSNLLIFFLGINVILFSGNLETLFIGWELIGISSFFLIAYYKDRYLPVKNALKVVSYYRIADIFLLLAIWAAHHAFGQGVEFASMPQLNFVQAIENHHFLVMWFIPLSLLVVAAVKSAQLPFSTWLPRAMEGPTTSSAIFYGSLSVHMGIFLMMRMSPLWENNTYFKIIMFAMGLFTTILATGIARVQSTVKTQIAYSSIAQIGLMYIWVSLGWEWFAIIHFIGNAFLRTYQLLVSPSVLSYLIHDQFFHFIKPQHNLTDEFFSKIRMTLYIWCLREFNLDNLMYDFLWIPIKKAGNALKFINKSTLWMIFLPIYLAGLYLAYNKDLLTLDVLAFLPYFFSLAGILMALRAFVERKSPVYAWVLIVVNNLFTTLTIAFNEQFSYGQIHVFLSGVILSSIVGLMSINRLKKLAPSVDLDRFYGYSRIYPGLSLIFLFACLGIIGFPITPTFIGEDLILGHIHENQYLLTAMTAISLIVDGLSIFRVYTRLFLGPYPYSNHEVAYRSS